MSVLRRRRIEAYVKGGIAAGAALIRQNRSLSGAARRFWLIAWQEGWRGVLVRLRGHTGPFMATTEVYFSDAPDQWGEQFDSLGPAEIDRARAHLASLVLPPVLILQIVTPSTVAHLEALATGWQASIHTDWTVALVPAAGLTTESLSAVQSFAASAPGLQVLRAPEDLSARIKIGTPVLIVHGPQRLNALSLYMLAEAAARTGADVVYADDDLLDENGNRTAPRFRPDFSPEYMRRFNYIGDVLLITRPDGLAVSDVLALHGTEIGAFDAAVSGILEGRRVEHVPFLLSHSFGRDARSPFPPAPIAADGADVAIVIPTRDKVDLVRHFVDSILETTAYPADRFEIVIVDNGSQEKRTLDYLAAVTAEKRNVRVVADPRPFNFSALNNAGAAATEQAILVFVNNDMEVKDPDWLAKLVHYATMPDVGAVGAKLVYPDGTIQHGGCALGVPKGTVQHLLVGRNSADVAAEDFTREMSVVTGACLAMRRDVFEEIGGFDPLLPVTWNDVKLCLQSLAAGYRNIYVADPILIHFESKSRGADLTPDHMRRFFREANHVRRQFPAFFRNDPSYSPNLSFDGPGQLAVPPRVRRPWLRGQRARSHVLMLSVVYRQGFGVPVVIQQQTLKLLELGYRVTIGGPESLGEIAFPGCERVFLTGSIQAAAWAFRNDVDLIVSHTPPFFEISVFIGPFIKVLIYDYGEPSASFFSDPTRSYLVEVDRVKRFATPLATAVATISQAVKDETTNNEAIVVGLANSHLAVWSEALRPERDDTRERLGFVNRFVVLTVCRFGRNERSYKGLDRIAAFVEAFPYMHPGKASDVLWVLAGSGLPEDVAEAEELGFTVFPNVSDDVLKQLYAAADAYMGFSRWEGYNLGIGQALALGLPTIASDIPAHREFPIRTSDSTRIVCNWLAEEIVARIADGPGRRPVVFPWAASVDAFAALVRSLLDAPIQERPASLANKPSQITRNVAS